MQFDQQEGAVGKVLVIMHTGEGKDRLPQLPQASAHCYGSCVFTDKQINIRVYNVLLQSGQTIGSLGNRVSQCVWKSREGAIEEG